MFYAGPGRENRVVLCLLRVNHIEIAAIFKNRLIVSYTRRKSKKKLRKERKHPKPAKPRKTGALRLVKPLAGFNGCPLFVRKMLWYNLAGARRGRSLCGRSGGKPRAGRTHSI